jgi:hypothetical protein
MWNLKVGGCYSSPPLYGYGMLSVGGSPLILPPRRRVWAVGAVSPPTYTATGAGAAPAATTAGTGTYAVPVYAGTGAAAAGAATTAGTGAYAVPVYAGSGGAIAVAVTTSGVATCVAPTYTGSGGATATRVTTSGVATSLSLPGPWLVAAADIYSSGVRAGQAHTAGGVAGQIGVGSVVGQAVE